MPFCNLSKPTIPKFPLPYITYVKLYISRTFVLKTFHTSIYRYVPMVIYNRTFYQYFPAKKGGSIFLLPPFLRAFCHVTISLLRFLSLHHSPCSREKQRHRSEHCQRIRYGLRQKYCKNFILEEKRQDKNHGNQQNNLPQHS